MSRVLVAVLPPASGAPCGVSVGVVRPTRPGGPTTVVVKLAFQFCLGDRDVTAQLEPRAEPLRLDEPSELDAAEPFELAYASDFAPAKAGCDIWLMGHAHAASAATRIAARWAIGTEERRFFAVAPVARSEIPLCRAHLRGSGDEPVTVGPVARRPSVSDAPVLAVESDPRRGAAGGAQLSGLAPDVAIELEGLSPRAPARTVRLPGIVPRLWIEPCRPDGHAVNCRCDTLWLDTDFERIVLRWCLELSAAELPAAGLQQLAVWLEAPGAAEPIERVLGRLAHARFGWAAEPEDVRARRVPALDPIEVELMRWQALQHEPQHALTLGEYASLSAALAEQDAPRAALLGRHGLDETSWAVEERAWLASIADSAMAGDASLGVELGEQFAAAQDALRRPGEPRPMAEYVELVVALEGAQDPAAVLREHGMGLAELARLERHWQREAVRDEAVADELESALERRRTLAAMHAEE